MNEICKESRHTKQGTRKEEASETKGNSCRNHDLVFAIKSAIREKDVVAKRERRSTRQS